MREHTKFPMIELWMPQTTRDRIQRAPAPSEGLGAVPFALLELSGSPSLCPVAELFYQFTAAAATAAAAGKGKAPFDSKPPSSKP